MPIHNHLQNQRAQRRRRASWPLRSKSHRPRTQGRAPHPSRIKIKHLSPAASLVIPPNSCRHPRKPRILKRPSRRSLSASTTRPRTSLSRKEAVPCTVGRQPPRSRASRGPLRNKLKTKGLMESSMAGAAQEICQPITLAELRAVNRNKRDSSIDRQLPGAAHMASAMAQARPTRTERRGSWARGNTRVTQARVAAHSSTDRAATELITEAHLRRRMRWVTKVATYPRELQSIEEDTARTKETAHPAAKPGQALQTRTPPRARVSIHWVTALELAMPPCPAFTTLEPRTRNHYPPTSAKAAPPPTNKGRTPKWPTTTISRTTARPK